MLSKLTHASFEGSSLDRATVGDFALVMLFAAHDTTLAMTQSILRYIALYPGDWRRVVAEVDTLWDGKSTLSDEILSRAVVARGFVEEVLRLVPPVGGLFRSLASPAEYEGYEIPADWKVMVNVSGMGRTCFGEQFAPDNIHRHSEFKGNEYFPFGGGRRMCIGYKLARQELYVWTIYLARHFDVACDPVRRETFAFNYHRVQVRLTHRSDGERPAHSRQAGA